MLGIIAGVLGVAVLLCLTFAGVITVRLSDGMAKGIIRSLLIVLVYALFITGICSLVLALAIM